MLTILEILVMAMFVVVEVLVLMLFITFFIEEKLEKIESQRKELKNEK